MTRPQDTRQLVRNSSASGETVIGTEESTLGVDHDVGIDDQHRVKHVLTVGQNGTGKTQLLLHAALQDAEKGRGFLMVNPKGGAIDELLAKLPEHRYDDVVYINPAYEAVTPINVLDPYAPPAMDTAATEHQREIIVSDVIDLFRRYSRNWGDRFNRDLRTLLRAHIDRNLHDDAGMTLVDVYRAVTDDAVLRDLIDHVADPILRTDLTAIKENRTQQELEPIQRRLQDFVENRTVRTVIDAAESGINFRQAINENQIVVVDVQKGEVGASVSQLVGSIVLTELWAAAQSRITIPAEDRHPYYCFIDEIQTYTGEESSFATILSEAREYRVGCWCVTQFLERLEPGMRQALANNARTKIVFDPTGSDEVSRVAGMLRGIDTAELRSLGDYRAVVQTPSDGTKQDAVVVDTYPPWDADRSHIDRIKHAATRPGPSSSEHEVQPSLGTGQNAGGDRHTALLQQAKQWFDAETDGHVQLLYQDVGSDRPDGHIITDDGDIHHLEAEAATLSKPGKVLANLRRAAEAGNTCVFVVDHGDAAKLTDILTDPVDRSGDTYTDEHGSYDYYQVDGTPITDLDTLRDAQYRIFEATDHGLHEYHSENDAECPELDDNNREALENFCLYRDSDGFCDALNQPCVLTDP